MNNAEQTDVSDHSLVAPDMRAGTAIIPGKSGKIPDFEICFLSDLYKKAPYPQCVNAKLALMRWIWAVPSSSTFSWNTNDADEEGGK